MCSLSLITSETTENSRFALAVGEKHVGKELSGDGGGGGVQSSVTDSIAT